MQRISFALGALISREQYRLKAASKVTQTDRHYIYIVRLSHRNDVLLYFGL